MEPGTHVERALMFCIVLNKDGGVEKFGGNTQFPVSFRGLITNLSRAVHSLGKPGARNQSVFIYFEVF